MISMQGRCGFADWSMDCLLEAFWDLKKDQETRMEGHLEIPFGRAWSGRSTDVMIRAFKGSSDHD